MIGKCAVCVCICVNPYVMIRGLLLFRCLPTSTLCLYSLALASPLNCLRFLHPLVTADDICEWRTSHNRCGSNQNGYGKLPVHPPSKPKGVIQHTHVRNMSCEGGRV